VTLGNGEHRWGATIGVRGVRLWDMRMERGKSVTFEAMKAHLFKPFTHCHKYTTRLRDSFSDTSYTTRLRQDSGGIVLQ